jgi:hypothetical protein
MSVRDELQKVREEFESKDSFFLQVCLRGLGLSKEEVDEMDRKEMIDRLMAFEEHAAFH